MTVDHDQGPYRIRCEWGENGVMALGASSDIIVIIDVLSFSTCVDVAVSRGATIYPYRWKGKGAEAFAKEQGAYLAGRRGSAEYSLSPASLQKISTGTRLVLPSPNGSTLTHLASEYSATVIAGCLRNAKEIGRFLSERGGRISIIPAGERWPDGSLRPALEDWIGAGAIITMLGANADRSSEAEAASDAFLAVENRLRESLQACSSGRELIDIDYGEDVLLATELNISNFVPILQNGGYKSKSQGFKGQGSKGLRVGSHKAAEQS